MKPSVLIFFCLFCFLLQVASASVVIRFSDGRKESFGNVSVVNGKLRCGARYEMVEFPPEQLAAKDRKQHFPHMTEMQPMKAPKTTVAPTEAVPALAPSSEKPPDPVAATKSFFHAFSGKLPASPHALIGYPPKLEEASYFIHIPPNYDGKKPFGLVAFIHAGDTMKLPAGWDKVLEEKELLYIAPQKAGNSLSTLSERLGLAVAGVLKMKEDYRIDPKRVYVAGFSGGARCATTLGYYASGVFSGAIGICGANFHEAVPRKDAAKEDDYGVQPASEKEVREAKRKVRFAIITGETDWRRGNILDVYNGGFEKQKFRAKLWDVPGLGHAICGPETFREAVDFIEEPGK